MKLAGVALVATAVLCANPAAALRQVEALPVGATAATVTAPQVIAGGSLTLVLPDRVVSVHGVTQSPAPGLFSLAARSADRTARLYAFVADGQLRAADVYVGAGHWRLVEHDDKGYWVAASELVTSPARAAAEPYTTGTVAAAAAGVAAKAGPDAGGIYDVRVLMLYTPELAEALGGAGSAAAEAHRLVALTNGIFETNAVPVRLAVADVKAYDAGDTPDFYANIDAMAASGVVRQVRDQTASDLVVLLRTGGDLCGLSSGFNPEDHSDPPANVNADRDAFNVVAVSDNCFDDVMAHEIGHSLSAGHDYASSAGYAYWKPYAHALSCADADSQRYFSLMWGQGIGPGGGRSDVITNPDAPLTPPCGSAGADGADASQAHNVRAMSEGAPYVAAYRGKGAGGTPAPGPGPGPGSGGGGALSGIGALLAAALLRRRRVG